MINYCDGFTVWHKELNLISTAVLYVALTTYHEARSEPAMCQLLVAETVRNRMDTRSLTAKQVVRQKHQYSWTSVIRGKSIKQEYKRIQRTADPADKEALDNAIIMAQWVLSPLYVSVSDVQYFHDTRIKTPKHFKHQIKCGGKLVFSK